MSNSTRPRPFGRRGAGTVTVIEARVHRSSARNARAAFCLTLVTVGAAAMVVAASYTHPIVAALVGLLIGGLFACAAWLLVRVWPVVRLIWWWLPEIGLTLALVYGWIQLADHTTLPLRLLAVGLVLAAAAIPAVRHHLTAVTWCVIVRHRLRVCFAQFIIANQSGSLPLILWAHPTPVGERVWIYLRPGLSHADLAARLDKIAVACHASSVLAERASERTAAYLRLDIKRREVLTATVVPPVADTLPTDTPTLVRAVDSLPDALDLPDIPAPGNGSDGRSRVNRTVTPVRPSPSPATRAPTASPANGAGPVDDITDWI